MTSKVQVHFFDSIGVPSPQAMIAEFGSGEEWQRSKTIEWMRKLAPSHRAGRYVLLEGQTRLEFIAEAAQAAGGLFYKPFLVDCDDRERTRRLCGDRDQPELATADMMDWARYLRDEAVASKVEVLDTSTQSLDECVERVIASFGQ